MSSNDRLWREFVRKWGLNQRGGLAARMVRWRVIHWLALQKLGVHRWVKARLFFGERMWVLTGETNSKGLLGFGYEQSALTAFMLKAVMPGMCVVDVGAHLGYEAVLASVLVGRSGKVVSFEPQPQISVWTSRNLEKFSQARAVQSAVGDLGGSVEFSEMNLLQSGLSGCGIKQNAARRTVVPIAPLNRLLRVKERPVHFIKCDVEGAEMSVLRGAIDILKSDQPLLVLEAEMPSESAIRPRAKEFDEFLSPLGYRGVSFKFDGDLRLAPLGSLHEGHANVAFVPVAKMNLFPMQLP